ncbi:MAG: M48 family metallopeptidase [Kiloniellaceae bacterium]
MALGLTDPYILRIKTREIPLEVRRHPRARRITLRFDGASGTLCLTLPRRAALREGLDFAEQKADWILAKLEALPARVPFQPGAVVPVLGEDHVIRHLPQARRGVRRADGAIWDSGPSEHVARRVAGFLKAEARRELSSRAGSKAATLGRPIGRIILRDMTSRWASCGEDGRLSFSWRLILAPEAVLDYVVAHEVAHLEEMNHGPHFWALASRLTPEVAGPRRWLRRHGDGLLRYG